VTEVAYKAPDLTEGDRNNVTRYLSSPLEFPSEFKKWLLDYLAQNIPPIPVNQLLGYVQTRAYVAEDIVTSEAQVSSSYDDLATVGPILTGMADGSYLVFHGCEIKSADGFSAKGWEALSINGSTPSDTKACRAFNGGTRVDIAFRGELVTLDVGGNNEIAMQYRSSLGIASFARRWMIAIRVA
jgi:hypothetical protein